MVASLGAWLVPNRQAWLRDFAVSGFANSSDARNSGTLMQCATLNVGTSFGPMQAAALSTRLLAKTPKLSAPTPSRMPSKVAREDEPLLVKAAKSGDDSA